MCKVQTLGMIGLIGMGLKGNVCDVMLLHFIEIFVTYNVLFRQKLLEGRISVHFIAHF